MSVRLSVRANVKRWGQRAAVSVVALVGVVAVSTGVAHATCAAPCGANETCVEDPVGTFTCECVAGMYGPTCASSCPGTAANPCGFGVCNDGRTGDGVCTCAAGYYIDAGGTLVTSGPDVCQETVCGDNNTASAVETCDDGNNALDDACPSGPTGSCLTATCGDGFVWTTAGGNEECDDAAANSDTLADACRTDCTNPRCGDGVEDTGEMCDDGNTSDSDDCPTNCQPSACGDGFLHQTDEGCDDGNQDNHDGCPDGVGGTCQVRSCGDGFVDLTLGPDGLPAEECDDNNSSDGDGCDSSCRLEPGYTCGGIAPTLCSLDCGTLFDFTTGPFNWRPRTGTNSLAHGAMTGGTTGFETALNDVIDFSPATYAIASTVAFPTLANVGEPRLELTYTLDVNDTGGSDCLRVFISTTGTPTSADEVFEDCVSTTSGTESTAIDVSAFAGTTAVVTVELVAGSSAVGRTGLQLSGVAVGGDADGDSVLDYKGLACGDGCVDGDMDGSGTAWSRDASTCGDGRIDDCDDSSALAEVGNTEVCDNGVDDDCNGGADAADSFCFEDCSNGIDDGGNGLVDCDDPFCDGTAFDPAVVDPFCADPCEEQWSFIYGPGPWIAETIGGTSIWNRPSGDPSESAWQTELPLTTNRYVGRFHLTNIPFGDATVVGPAPAVEVEFLHQGDAASRDVLAVCVNDTACEGNQANINVIADSPSTTWQKVTVDLSAFLGDPTITLTILYDTFEGNVPMTVGASVRSIRLFSDVDGDGFSERGVAGCDPCYDADNDFYGDPASPDLTACLAFGPDPANPLSDCDDTDINVSPVNATELNCSNGKDDDCDGLVDAFDAADCGAEDCANGVDDNGDGNIDCADPICAGSLACGECSFGYDFVVGEPTNGTDTGASGAWLSTGRVDDPTPPTDRIVFQYGTSTTHNANGWDTRLNADVDAATAGSWRTQGWLTRTIDVPPTMPEPRLDLRYFLEGADGTTTLGVCFNVATTTCNAGQPGNFAWFTTSNTVPTGGAASPVVNDMFNDGYYDHALIPIPKNANDVVIVYDTVDAAGASLNAPGVFIERLVVRSDIDLDGLPENVAGACDTCVDRDGDGRGDPSVVATDLISCPVADVVDCDDEDASVYPRPAEMDSVARDLCYVATDMPVDKDNDCDGLVDGQDPDCIICGNGRIETGETCDDSNTMSNDGCSATCQVEAGSLYVTELHLAVVFGNTGEQWLELYNASNININVRDVNLALANGSGQSASFALGDTSCTVHSTFTIVSGGYYVISFGAPNQSDFAQTADIDATCTLPLANGGDTLTLTQETGGNVQQVDQVDFTSWSCLTQNAVRQLPTGPLRGRSMMLRDPTNSNSAVNDDVSRWCLAGPTDTYSSTGAHLGSPRGPGACSELICDGVDDDCNGITDEGLTDTDMDGVCDAQDCEPTIDTCSTGPSCTNDDDGDGRVDCSDACTDNDGDGYGSPGLADSPGNPLACAGFEDLICDTNVLAFPGNPEFDPSLGANQDFKCTNGLDDDCSGLSDCLDPGCASRDVCEAETCARAVPLACGDIVEVRPLSDDFDACIAGAASGGADAVYSFTSPSNGEVTFIQTNLGTKRFGIELATSCSETSCTDVVETANTGCVSGGRLDATVVGGQTYFVRLQHVGSECSQGSGGLGELVVSCAEACDGLGIDEDADGDADCADTDCIASAACADSDFDNDGVSNGDELICGTDPLVAGEQPTDDAFLDPDLDLMLNCVDLDDDNDGASDTTELANCANPTSKNDPMAHPELDICGMAASPCGDPAPEECDLAQVDANCNGQFDTTEAVCGVREDNCGDNIDNDSDSDVDCFDEDCVLDPFCQFTDFDQDGSLNITELFCLTDPLDGSSFPSPPQLSQDPDEDDIPNCADDDDDNDSFTDTEEIICGSSPLDAASTPTDTDGDGQCDNVDLDDDNDLVTDEAEVLCASDPLDATSLPTDPEHDNDGDGQCNEIDVDDDGDSWFDFQEAECQTDPLDAGDNPTANGEDLDGDRRCDLVDNDDDGDGWTDDEELACGTDALDGASEPADCDNDGDCDAVDVDDDGDNVNDAVEQLCGTNICDITDVPSPADAQDPDNDQIPSCVDDDDDGDGLSDVLEAVWGTDPLDEDTDDDGLLDGDEDADLDGELDPTETSPLQKDTDGDGLSDFIEVTACYLGAPDACEPSEGYTQDTDGDGLSDRIEDDNRNGLVDAGETNPLVVDTDDDGFDDSEEALCNTDGTDPDSQPVDLNGDDLCDGGQEDTDGDGVPDAVEEYCGYGAFDAQDTPPLMDLEDLDGDGAINCVDADDDDDGIEDDDEIHCQRDHRDASDTPTLDDIEDYDGDALFNCVDNDDDNDGISDVAEQLGGTDPYDSDSDDDGLTDGREVSLEGTDPLDFDSDDDGVSDGVEVGVFTADRDSDPAVFVPDDDPSNTTLPNNPDTDGDGVLDGEEDANGNGRIDDGEGNPNDPTDGLADTDGDKVPDRLEILVHGTDPNDIDSDDDGLDDNLEINVHFTDPLNADTDGGGIDDGQELANATDPNSGSDDFSVAELSGDTVFGCRGTTGHQGLWWLLALGLIGALARRQRRRATHGSR